MILGIDYGTQNIGLALADGPLAEPLGTQPTSTILSKLPEIISKNNITKIVIGNPTGPVQASLQKFIQSLTIFNCEIITVDETLSSHDANMSLHHVKKSHRKSKEHSVAAALILQSYLDNLS